MGEGTPCDSQQRITSEAARLLSRSTFYKCPRMTATLVRVEGLLASVFFSVNTQPDGVCLGALLGLVGAQNKPVQPVKVIVKRDEDDKAINFCMAVKVSHPTFPTLEEGWCFRVDLVYRGGVSKVACSVHLFLIVFVFGV